MRAFACVCVCVKGVLAEHECEYARLEEKGFGCVCVCLLVCALVGSQLGEIAWVVLVLLRLDFELRDSGEEEVEVDTDAGIEEGSEVGLRNFYGQL